MAVRFVVTEFEVQHKPWFDYPFPIVKNNELYLFKERFEEVSKEFGH